MRVVFDAQIFCAQKFGGISRYFASLAREFSVMPGINARIVAPLHVNDYAARLPSSLIVGRRFNGFGKARAAAGMLSCIAGEFAQYALSPDIIHQTYFYPQPRLPRRARTVVSVYDMTYERFPENFRPNDPVPRWKRKAVSRADHVICISEHTRRDLLQMCDVRPERVSVTYLGYDPLESMLKDEVSSTVRVRLSELDRPYLLYVGSRRGSKNFANLVRAFAGSRVLREEVSLVCFGGGGWTEAERKLIATSGAEGSIHQASGPDAELAAAYKHAIAFVYPSLYEGFGIPPLEAMSLDCPVACSSASSIPEVVGDAAVQFDPNDVDAIREALERLLTSPQLRADLVARGRVRKDMFSWQRCARETARIYEETLAS